jgi:hypothetical protein
VAAFATAADLTTFIQDASYDVATLDQALSKASSTIRAYTGQELDYWVGDVVVLTPRPGSVVYLPQLPVQAVSLVEILTPDYVTGVDTWTSLVGGYRFNAHGAVYLTRSLATWPTGWDTVRVTYDHGYHVIPEPIRYVCLELAARSLDNPYKDSSRRTDVLQTDMFSRSAKDVTMRDTERETLSRYTLHEVA